MDIYSINPNNNKKYKIPKVLDDSENIEIFLNENRGKKVVVVQGLGFVGAVMSLVCANSDFSDYAVIGIDLPNENSYWRIASINEGIFPLISSDNNVYKLFKQSIRRKNFYATYDNLAYSKADVIIVDINLDVNKKTDFYGNLTDFDVDIEPFKNAITTIGQNCKENVLILVETTVPPGTTKNYIYPIIKAELEKRKLCSKNFFLGHSYERVMPGPNYVDSIINFYRVYSGINNLSALKVKEFLESIIRTDEYPLTMLSNTNATEIAKVLENSYRASNIAFMVEWSRFSEKADVNIYEVIDAIKMRPTHSNMMYPGIGVGGYCLTKDPLLAYWSNSEIFNNSCNLEHSKIGVKTNDKMPFSAFQFLKQNPKYINIKNKTAILLGVSYRSDVGDTRYSPVENFYNYLKNDDCEIYLHDPYVKFWKELDIKIDSTDDTFTDINRKKFNIAIFTTSHKEYKESKYLYNFLNSQNKLLIFDTVGVLSEKDIKILSKKHHIIILGRGDYK